MKRILFVFALATGIVACQKSLSKEQEFITKDFFYRLAAYDATGKLVDYSHIITTKIGVGSLTGELRGTAQTGDQHYEGDGCDENKPKFCEKHPWHKKCPKQILGLRMSEFATQKGSNYIVITWKLQNEGVIAEFAVDRSEDGLTWASKAKIKSRGDNTTYTFKDYNK